MVQVLTNMSGPNATHDAITPEMYARTARLIGFDPAVCGWYNLPIRRMYARPNETRSRTLPPAFAHLPLCLLSPSVSGTRGPTRR